MSTPVKKRYLRLESLVAFLQTEKDGDEIFIKYKGEKIAPADAKFIRMGKESARLNVEIELDEGQKWVELELWDYDRFTPNDHLGTFRLLADERGENFTAELLRGKESEGKYVLNWSLVERLAKPSKAKS